MRSLIWRKRAQRLLSSFPWRGNIKTLAALTIALDGEDL
jgi:hypothetical protein